MKILKLKLFQETACYRKPFATNIAETYPLPPYSTIMGMLHNILEAKTGEFYKFNLSVQGDYESIYNEYTHIRKFLNASQKSKYKKIYGQEINAITKPINIMRLHNVSLIIHVQGEDDIINKIYENITTKGKPIVLGQNDNIARLDYLNFITCKDLLQETILQHNAYVLDSQSANGTHFRLNTYYTLKNDTQLKTTIRHFEQVNVRYVPCGTPVFNCAIDAENDLVFFV